MLLTDITVRHGLQLYTKVTATEDVSQEDRPKVEIMSLQLMYKNY